MSEVRAEILAKILLIQNVLGQLPDETSMFSFICKGLEDVASVAKARFEPEGSAVAAGPKETPDEQRFQIAAGDMTYGVLVLQISDALVFAPYRAFISNLCFMIALVLEERRQRQINLRHQEELERRVIERTRQLSEEKERLAVTLRSIGDGVITTDTQGVITNMNKAAEQLTGWKQADARGLPLLSVFRIVDSETRAPLENPGIQVINTGLNVELSNRTLLIPKAGAEHPVATSAAPIRNRESVTIGVVLVFRDMSEKLKLQETLQRNDRLDALGVLAGGIAHDFNNLLAGLFGYMDLAREDCKDGAVLDSLDKAVGVFNRAKNLTQQLLTFAKGGSPLKKTVSPGPLLRDCTAFALSGSRIAHVYDIEKDLWLCDFDPNQMAQVIDNMVINAKQAMPEGGRISVSAKNVTLDSKAKPSLPGGPYVCISISDTGQGIPPDKLPRIFDPFFTTKETGSGLGLATCHSIIHKHEGLIEVDSIVGKGTTFRIYLPASNKQANASGQNNLRRHRGSGLVMVMDDEDYMREIMVLALKSMGYEPVSACGGQEALDLWAAHKKPGEKPFKALFLDLTIRGGIGGQQTVSELRKQGAQIPIFATSGYSGDPIMAHPSQFGFSSSLVKPFTLVDFSDFMDAHMPALQTPEAPRGQPAKA